MVFAVVKTSFWESGTTSVTKQVLSKNLLVYDGNSTNILTKHYQHSASTCQPKNLSPLFNDVYNTGQSFLCLNCFTAASMKWLWLGTVMNSKLNSTNRCAHWQVVMQKAKCKTATVTNWYCA